MSLNRGKIKVQSTAKKLAKPKDVIYSPEGQWKYPGQVTRIPSNNITMHGVPYPVLGIDDEGNQQMMHPGMNYQFPGNYVTEYPQMQSGGPTKAKAAEMLYDGTAHGQPLTAKQKRYFGMLAHMQTGGQPLEPLSDEELDKYMSLKKQIEEEHKRVSTLKDTLLKNAANKDIKNIPARTSLSYLKGKGEFYCATHNCELMQDSGYTVPSNYSGENYKASAKFPIIPGNLQFQSMAPELGFIPVDPKDLQPGDIVQEQVKRKEDYQGKPFKKEQWTSAHNLIYAGKDKNGENIYYNAPSGSKKDYVKSTIGRSKKDYKLLGWRYQGDLGTLSKEYNDLDQRFTKTMAIMPPKDIKQIGVASSSFDDQNIPELLSNVTPYQQGGQAMLNLKKYLQRGGYLDRGVNPPMMMFDKGGMPCYNCGGSHMQEGGEPDYLAGSAQNIDYYNKAGYKSQKVSNIPKGIAQLDFPTGVKPAGYYKFSGTNPTQLPPSPYTVSTPTSGNEKKSDQYVPYFNQSSTPPPVVSQQPVPISTPPPVQQPVTTPQYKAPVQKTPVSTTPVTTTQTIPGRAAVPKSQRRGVQKLGFNTHQYSNNPFGFQEGGENDQQFPTGNEFEDEKNEFLDWLRGTSFAAIQDEMDNQNEFHMMEDGSLMSNDEMEEEQMKNGGNWLKGAVNPKHKGYCTPMTKKTCTPRRKAFAMTMKKHHGFHKKQTGGGFAETTTQIDPVTGGNLINYTPVSYTTPGNAQISIKKTAVPIKSIPGKSTYMVLNPDGTTKSYNVGWGKGPGETREVSQEEYLKTKYPKFNSQQIENVIAGKSAYGFGGGIPYHDKRSDIGDIPYGYGGDLSIANLDDRMFDDGGAQNGFTLGWGFQEGGTPNPWVQYLQGRGYGPMRGEMDLNTVPQYTPSGSDFNMTPQNKMYLQGQMFPTDSIVPMPNSPGVGIAYINGKPVIVPTDKSKKKEVDAWKAKHMKVAQEKKGKINPFYFQAGGDFHDQMDHDDAGGIPRTDRNDAIYQQHLEEELGQEYSDKTVDDILKDRIEDLGFDAAMQEYRKYVLGEEEVNAGDTSEEGEEESEPSEEEMQMGGYNQNQPRLNPNNNLGMFTQAYNQSRQQNDMGDAYNTFLNQGMQMAMNAQPYYAQHGGSPSADKYAWRSPGFYFPANYTQRYSYDNPEDANYVLPKGSKVTNIQAGYGRKGDRTKQRALGKFFGTLPKKLTITIRMPNGETVEVPKQTDMPGLLDKMITSPVSESNPYTNPGFYKGTPFEQKVNQMTPETEQELPWYDQPNQPNQGGPRAQFGNNPNQVQYDEYGMPISQPFGNQNSDLPDFDSMNPNAGTQYVQNVQGNPVTADQLYNPNSPVNVQKMGLAYPEKSREQFTDKNVGLTRHRGINPEDAVNWGFSGMNLATKALNQGSVNRREEELRGRSMAENLYAPTPRNSRGDYSVNEGYFQPQNMVPVQYSGMPGVYSKMGGQNDFQEGGEYYLTDEEIRRIQEAGGEIDFIED
jgi:hypothetical protein